MLTLDPADQVLAYLRPALPGDRTILVLLNYGATPWEVKIPEQIVQSLSPDGKLIDLLQGERVTTSSYDTRVSLPGHGVRLLQGE